MRRILLLMIAIALAALSYAQPCSKTNGSNCLCADGTTNCDMLPDLMISWYGMQQDVPTEYSQTGNGADNGRLRITGSTPNVGFGSFTVLGTDYFICGTDTIHDPGHTLLTCPDGSQPTNLLIQRIYHKNGSAITYTDRWAGGQTYHSGHGHNHVDDWVTFTLRTEDPNQPDTLQWPIIGTGAKIGFCLMDLSNCNSSTGHCRTDHRYNQGTVLTGTNFPNYGFGGGTYNCSPVEQGISSGYVDIYSQGLDGMWIDIPPGTCNGDYWIVAQVDPRNNFLESNENNNWTAIPITLTKQVPVGSAAATINMSSAPYLCNGSSVTLNASMGQTYLWSNGETTASINVTQPGDYFVQVSGQCGNAISDTITISTIPSTVNSVMGDTVCMGGTAVVTATGAGTIQWYDDFTGGNLLGTGASYTAGAVNQNTTVYVQNTASSNSQLQTAGPTDHAGNSFSGDTYNAYISFDAYADFTIASVKVYTDMAGIRTIQLRDLWGTVINDTTLNISMGTTRIGLNFEVPAGYGYTLGTDTMQNLATFGYMSPRLRRSDSGVVYPYEIPNLLSMTGSPHGSTFYYYFYDWEVTTAGFSCPSPRVPVEINVEHSSPISFSLGTAYLNTDVPVQVTASIPNGTFSGRGITTDGNGNSWFSPTLAGAHDSIAITYQYTTPHGCAADTVIYVSVLRETGIAELTDSRLLFYPNPAQNTVTVVLPAQISGGAFSVFDATGKKVMDIPVEANSARQALDISELARGIYILRLDGPGGNRFGKLSKL